MGLDVRDRFNKFSQATDAYIKRKWESRSTSAAEAAELRRRVEEHDRFLSLVAAKVAGPSAAEMPALRCRILGKAGNNNNDNKNITTNKAVFLVTLPIAFGRFELTRSTHRLLTRHLGMTMNSVSHWALCVVDRVPGAPSYAYDLMSDQLAPINALGKNQFRVIDVTPDYIRTWTACYYVGETAKSHEVIQQLGKNFMAVNPRYNLLSNNCQNLVESLVKLLCDGTAISEPMLNEELSAISPKLTRDLMVARLRSKMDAATGDSVAGADADAATDAAAVRPDVKEDVDIIKTLWQKVHR